MHLSRLYPMCATALHMKVGNETSKFGRILLQKCIVVVIVHCLKVRICYLKLRYPHIDSLANLIRAIIYSIDTFTFIYIIYSFIFFLSHRHIVIYRTRYVCP